MKITYIKYSKKNCYFFNVKRINSKISDIYPYENYKGNKNVHTKFT
jgi:hypothetical protein